jgi:hypothetical protein
MEALADQAMESLVSRAGAVAAWLRERGEERPLVNLLCALELGFAAGRWGPPVRGVNRLKIAFEATGPAHCDHLCQDRRASPQCGDCLSARSRFYRRGAERSQHRQDPVLPY